jgi:hypothetical protein
MIDAIKMQLQNGFLQFESNLYSGTKKDVWINYLNKNVPIKVVLI